MYMPFGKYKGQDVEDVPSPYLRWFCENIEPDSSSMEDLIEICEEEYNFREKHNCHIFE